MNKKIIDKLKKEIAEAYMLRDKAHEGDFYGYEVLCYHNYGFSLRNIRLVTINFLQRH